MNNDDLEAIWVDVFLPKNKPVLIGAFYRPPNQGNFMGILENVCASSQDFLSTEVILLGNINFLNEKGVHFKALGQFLRMCGLSQLLTEPTRITDCTETLIDIIMVSDNSKISQRGFIEYGISDHFLTYCTRKVRRVTVRCHKTIKSRSMRGYNIDKIKDLIKGTDW